MRLAIGFLGVGIVLAMLSAPSVAQDPNAAANRLFVQAQKLLQEPSPPGSEDRLARLKQARDIAGKIIDEHPASNLAVQLVSGQPIGTFWLKTIDEEISKTTGALRVDRARRDAPRCAANPEPSCIVIQLLALAQASNPLMSRLDVLSTIAETQERLGDRQGALETIAFLKDLSGKAERGYEKSAARRSIMKAQIAIGRTREALQDAGAMDEADQKDALFAIARSLANRGKRDEALQIVESLKDPHYKAYAILLVAERDAENGRRQQAIAALSPARRIADALGEPAARSGTLSMIGGLEARLGIPGAADTFDAAISTARGIEGEPLRGDQLEGIARHLTRAKRFTEAVDLARSIASITSKARALVFIASSKEAPVELSRELLDEALPVARTMPDDIFKEFALRDIASAWAAGGQMDQALATVDLILKPRDRQSALSAMAKSVSSRGRLDEALGITEKISDNLQKAIALSNIAVDMAKARGMKPAYELVQSIKEDYPRLTGLHNLIKAGD